MDLNQYLENKKKQSEQETQHRYLCTTCVQPGFSCYCKDLQRFDCNISFVILIHPIEVRRRIATGRMSYLSLENSHMVMGQDYSENQQIQDLLKDPNYHSVMLYPGLQSVNLSELNPADRYELFPKNKKLRIFVIDGTWATAKKTIRQSKNLKNLPRICFAPDKISNFRVRKQPADYCYSTIEAIHQTIELVGQSQGFNVHDRGHDRLLRVFNGMVERQLDCVRRCNENPELSTYKRTRRRDATA